MANNQNTNSQIVTYEVHGTWGKRALRLEKKTLSKKSNL